MVGGDREGNWVVGCWASAGPRLLAGPDFSGVERVVLFLFSPQFLDGYETRAE